MDIARAARPFRRVAMVNKTALAVHPQPRHRQSRSIRSRKRPVPASDVPGEQASPTQPFPVKPPLGKLSWQRGDITNVTPEHRAFLRRSSPPTNNALPA